MVLLKNLNQECAVRPVSRAIPAHIACRLLGNSIKPCHLDTLCRPCSKSGVWLFYSGLLLAGCSLFFVVFWFLRVTRLSRLLGPLAALLLPPLNWLAQCFAAAYNFYRKLPF
ncbi:MAG TPA: hypothetical protein PLM07_10560 [Candidatus Rifleibacterium sp.]|nr:hypothetical protein [Candidatus Rifleibacterium sp.]HPT46332.1 hypothetical protein [Candidatus Rifleibacterium sp.]